MRGLMLGPGRGSGGTNLRKTLSDSVSRSIYQFGKRISHDKKAAGSVDRRRCRSEEPDVFDGRGGWDGLTTGGKAKIS